MTSKIEMTAILRGIREISRASRVMSNDTGTPAPSTLVYQFDSSSSETTAATESFVRRNVSSEIQQAIVLDQLKTDDEISRLTAVEGLGDRTLALTNTSEKDVGAIHPFAITYESASVSTIDYKPTQKDMVELRDAIFSFSKRELLVDPAQSEETFQAAVDSVFGEGVADLFHVRLENRGAGRSEVVIRQLEYADLQTDAEQDIVTSAVVNAQANFKTRTHQISLEGADIDEGVRKLQSALGMEIIPVVENLRAALKSGEGVEEALMDLRSFAEDMNLGADAKSQVDSFIEGIVNLRQNAELQFDANPLFDDTRVKYSSGKFGLAWGSDEIEATAALTANWDFLES